MRINVPVGVPYFEGKKVLDGNTYRITIRWSDINAKWYMDLNGISNTVAINGVALLGGYDLLKSHGYAQLGELRVVDNIGEDTDPDFDSLGARHTLEYFPVDRQ